MREPAERLLKACNGTRLAYTMEQRATFTGTTVAYQKKADALVKHGDAAVIGVASRHDCLPTGRAGSDLR